MQQRREHAQRLLAATQAVLHKQAAAWTAACAAVGQLVTQLSEAHDRHKEGHAAMQSGIQKALEMTHQAQSHSLMGKCVGFAHDVLSQMLMLMLSWIDRRPVSVVVKASIRCIKKKNVVLQSSLNSLLCEFGCFVSCCKTCLHTCQDQSKVLFANKPLFPFCLGRHNNMKVRLHELLIVCAGVR